VAICNITFYDCSSTKWFPLRLYPNNFFTQIVAVGKVILFKGITHIYSRQLVAGSGPGLERFDAFLGHSCSAGGH